MKLTKYMLTTFFCLIFAQTVLAKEVEVEAQGVGDDYDWAVLNAVENAVRQTSPIEVQKSIPEVKAVGAYKGELDVKKDSVLSKDKNLNIKEEFTAQFKTIEASYQGKVKSYKVLSMEEKENKVYVKILATVEKIEDYKSPELVKKAEYKMAVMPFKGMRSYNCVGTPIALSKLNESLTNSITNKLSKTQKFSLVDRNNLDDYANEASLIAAGLTKSDDKSKLQNIAAADYMIVGSISEFQAKSSVKKIEITDEEYAKSSMKLAVDYRIIEVATTEVLFSDTAEATIRKDKRLGSCSVSLNKVTDDIADTIVKDSLSTIYPDYQYVPVKKEAKESHKRTTTTTVKKKEVVKLPFDR
ncbi:MAG: CsgG/HfaB family protein [Alphaproteobacteria bacterium]|nr:CsgG/HfaB family protein [Alphaproteobacteria bacterium]